VFGIAVLGFLPVIENFFYTMTGIGLKSTDHPAVKLAFLVMALVVAFYWSRAMVSAAESLLARARRMADVVLLVSMAGLAPGVVQHAGARSERAAVPTDLPNVVILSSDGVNAENMSVYGYARETTPFLDSKAAEFAIFEFSFANSYGTYGSMASMLTGMSPITIGIPATRPVAARCEAEPSSNPTASTASGEATGAWRGGRARERSIWSTDSTRTRVVAWTREIGACFPERQIWPHGS
jgi:hypothetical protein